MSSLQCTPMVPSPIACRRIALGLAAALTVATVAHAGPASAAAVGSSPSAAQERAAAVAEASAPRSMPHVAEQVRPAVVTIRTIAQGQDEPRVVGTGFMVDRAGRVVTSYHVVSTAARQPKAYRLELTFANGHKGGARIVGFDLVDDLALLQLDEPDISLARPIRLPTAAQGLPHGGASLIAVGDAAGMGVIATVGHYSGRVDQAGFDRLHYTGTLNSGMSGGPTVDVRGVLVGVNASFRRGAQQMGFLVPAERVRALLARATSLHGRSMPASTDEILRQLGAFHQTLIRDAGTTLPSRSYGPYAAPDFAPGRLKCSPIGGVPDDGPQLPAATVEGRDCRLVSAIEVEDGLEMGYLEYSHRYLRAGSLNSWRFHSLADSLRRNLPTMDDYKVMAQPHCLSQTTRAGKERALPVHLTFCIQAYREFAGLYDVTVRVLTRDRAREALLSHLRLFGVNWAQAQSYTTQLLENLH